VAYAGGAKHLVAAWKEHGLRRAGAVAAELVVTTLPRPAADVIAYIPADEHRLLERGHHPAQCLALELGTRWEIPVAQLLRRVPGHPSSRQATLARPDRLRNARGAFVATGGAPPRVVVVDDVYTTGATADAAASALCAGGTDTVEVVTFARTTRL
jgi:predicted amidophosphoribosyltransferase